MSGTTDQRVLTEHTRPFAVPESLDDLRGPDGAVIELPQHVYWGPDRRADLSGPSGIRKAYEAVIREGLIDDVLSILNPLVLRREWRRLLVPVRIAAVWEARFPELAG
jgi:hypothetical protein